MNKKASSNLPIIGWREWLALPELGIKKIKAKVDTGARSSSLHAYDLQLFEKNSEMYVRFKVHPVQRNSKEVVETEAKILEYRSVRSSSGKAELRPVILSSVELLGQIWSVDLTLTNRDAMGFRMLLGREAIRRKFLVDTGNSYYGGRPKRKKKTSQHSSSKLKKE